MINLHLHDNYSFTKNGNDDDDDDGDGDGVAVVVFSGDYYGDGDGDDNHDYKNSNDNTYLVIRPVQVKIKKLCSNNILKNQLQFSSRVKLSTRKSKLAHTKLLERFKNIRERDI